MVMRKLKSNIDSFEEEKLKAEINYGFGESGFKTVINSFQTSDVTCDFTSYPENASLYFVFNPLYEDLIIKYPGFDTTLSLIRSNAEVSLGGKKTNDNFPVPQNLYMVFYVTTAITENGSSYKICKIPCRPKATESKNSWYLDLRLPCK
jgi:hypothetical protein